MVVDLAALRGVLERSGGLAELAVAAAELGVAAAEQVSYGAQRSASLALTLPEPAPAAALCAAMGWARPLAVSGDVEQRRWHIQLWAADLADPYARRVATRLPEVGSWRVTAWLAGRPEGPLPGLVAGASPAYDLAERPAAVVRLDALHFPDGM